MVRDPIPLHPRAITNGTQDSENEKTSIGVQVHDPVYETESQDLSPEDEAKVTRKLDLFVMPILGVSLRDKPTSAQRSHVSSSTCCLSLTAATCRSRSQHASAHV